MRARDGRPIAHLYMFPQGETGMTDTTLSREQALALLQRLATDDEFRTSYEASPAAALKSAGISAALVDSLTPASVAPTKLRAKDVFQRAYDEVREEIAEVCLCHRPPTISLKSGGTTRAKGDGTTTSFSDP